MRWIYAAGEQRRSRLHDYQGQMLPLEALADGPRVFAQSFRRRLTGMRPGLPWIPYPAIRALEGLLTADSSVLEFGAGMSTAWFGLRAAQVRSIESDRKWYEIVLRQLASRGLVNVELSLCAPADYARLPLKEHRDYDVVVVDGIQRAECLRTALHVVKAGGSIYLDNSDNRVRDLDEADAVEELIRGTRERSGRLRYLRGFPPAQPTVTEGVLATLADEAPQP
jgi:predicted O-methyltransferase YrrM